MSYMFQLKMFQRNIWLPFDGTIATIVVRCFRSLRPLRSLSDHPPSLVIALQLLLDPKTHFSLARTEYWSLRFNWKYDMINGT